MHRSVAFPLPSFLKVRMDYPAVLLLSSQIRSVTPALQAGACVAPSIANPTNKMANGRHLTTWKEGGSNANIARHFPLPNDCRCARRFIFIRLPICFIDVFSPFFDPYSTEFAANRTKPC